MSLPRAAHNLSSLLRLMKELSTHDHRAGESLLGNSSGAEAPSSRGALTPSGHARVRWTDASVLAERHCNF